MSGWSGRCSPMIFFHPDHVVPAPELIAAVVEGTGRCEAQMLVELGAVFGEVFVLRLRVADAGVEVEDTHGLEPVGQRLIEDAAQSAAPGVVVEVDGQLCGPVVGGTSHKGVGIGVALDAAIPLDDEIGIFFHDVPHPVLELGKRRHIVLESDDRVLDVVGVDLQNAGCVGQCGVVDGNILHCLLPL